MRKLIDPEVMRHCEAAYFRASGVASIDVMEVAACALANAALERFPEARRVFVACGPGGNGGDGYACARILRDAGLDVRVYPAAPAKSPDAIANAARVRELIRDAESEGSRTPVDSGAGCAPGTPNNMPSGIQAPSPADAQHTDTKANRAQFCKRSPADPTANKGIRIPNGASGMLHPSGAKAHPTDAETNRAQFGSESSPAAETPLAQVCEESSANSTANDGIRIPYSTPVKLPPSGADAQPADADALRAQFGAESSAVAEASLAQTCKRSSADSMANGGIRIPDSASAKIHPSIADAQPADAKASQAQFSEISSANSTANDGFRISNGAPMKLQSPGMEAQSADAGMPLGYANGKSSTDVETPLAQACEQSSANSTANDDIRIPDSTPAKAHPSGADAQPADAETNRAQFDAESSAAAEAPLAQACERSSANSTANDGIRIPNSTPAKLPPSSADTQPADAKTIQASFGAESPAGSIANGLIQIPYGTPAKLPPSGADVQPADAETNRAQFGAESSSAAEAPLALAYERTSANFPVNDCIQIPNNTPAKLHLSTANAQPADANPTQTQDTLEACPASGHAAPCGPIDPTDIPDLWIDCLYGTGLSRAPSGVAAELIARMKRDRAAGAKVLAADIPSGLNGATGARFEPCVEADCTVAFQFAKPGHLLGDGLDICGELRVADVGFPEAAFPANLPAQIEPSDLRGMFAPRRRNIHKGSCGHLLIVAGSFGMAGAAALCARAALRNGVGLVSIACPASIVPILQGLAPCAMCVPLPERDGAISPEAVEPLRAALRGKSAAVIGPGLSRRAAPEIVAAVLESGLPAVIDADALNLLAENPALKPLLRPHHILTPHPGEAARLLGHPCANPIAAARELATLGAQGEIASERSTSQVRAENEAEKSCAKASPRTQAAPADGCMKIATSADVPDVLPLHPGKAARLLGHPCADPIADARELAELGARGETASERSTSQVRSENEAANSCAKASPRAQAALVDRCTKIATSADISDVPPLHPGEAEQLPDCACADPTVDAKALGTLDTPSAQSEAMDKRAAIPVIAQGEEADNREQDIASRSCPNSIADSQAPAAPGAINAQEEVTGECAAEQSRVQNQAAENRTESIASRSCSNPIADSQAHAVLGATSAREEAEGECATSQSCAQSEAANHRAEGAASRCYSAPIADAQTPAALGVANVQGKAASGCTKTLACMEEKPVEALNRHVEIPVEARGKRVEALEHTQGEALDNCAEIPAEAQGKHAEALTSAQGKVLDACAEILADARMNPVGAREGIRTGISSGPTAVLKGASRVIAGGEEVYVSVSGCPGMARGGSGDVYAGILGALLAEKSGRTPAQSVAAACELHGLAGELAQAKYGPRSMNSADLIEFLPEVFRRYVD